MGQCLRRREPPLLMQTKGKVPTTSSTGLKTNQKKREMLLRRLSSQKPKCARQRHGQPLVVHSALWRLVVWCRHRPCKDYVVYFQKLVVISLAPSAWSSLVIRALIRAHS